jgi:hypothetical protein
MISGNIEGLRVGEHVVRRVYNPYYFTYADLSFTVAAVEGPTSLLLDFCGGGCQERWTVEPRNFRGGGHEIRAFRPSTRRWYRLGYATRVEYVGDTSTLRVGLL